MATRMLWAGRPSVQRLRRTRIISSNDWVCVNRRTFSAYDSLLEGSKSSTEKQQTSQDPEVAVSDWEDDTNYNISEFSQLPSSNFGVNQHMSINHDFREALRQIPWQFRAPIRYAFAYGSGVFPQSKLDGSTATDEEVRAVHPKAPLAVSKAQGGKPKMIDFIFGVTHTQHWHSLNLTQHRDHYSALGSIGSGAVTYVQEHMGAGVYFNTNVIVNGTLIKYGVVNMDTLCRDLQEWDTLYLAGRLHKPVKILRDDARVRLANQVNLISALRTALLLLPEKFTEMQLYSTITGISYLGDPRMSLPTENPNKVNNIVHNNLANFRRLYVPLIETLPNLQFTDPRCSKPHWELEGYEDLRLTQDMSPIKRGNMVRRLPKKFRSKLYFQYQKKLMIPQHDFDAMMEASSKENAESFKKVQGGGFERRIAQDDSKELKKYVRTVIKQTIGWPSTTQSLKGLLTVGPWKTVKYVFEKWQKYKEGSKPVVEEPAKGEQDVEKSQTPESASEIKVKKD